MAQLLKNLQSLLPDMLLVAGSASIAYGAWIAYPPAGYIIGGAFAIAAGMRIA